MTFQVYFIWGQGVHSDEYKVVSVSHDTEDFEILIKMAREKLPSWDQEGRVYKITKGS